MCLQMLTSGLFFFIFFWEGKGDLLSRLVSFAISRVEHSSQGSNLQFDHRNPNIDFQSRITSLKHQSSRLKTQTLKVNSSFKH